MITQEKLTQLYEKIVNNKTIKTKELNELGFNSTDITKLLETGKLIRLERGIYEFIDLNDLYEYGLQYFLSKDYEKANQVFEKCYLYGYKNDFILTRLFYTSIKNNNIEDSIKYISELIDTQDEQLIKDINLYLLLISYIANLPSNLKTRVDIIKQDYNSIMLNAEDQRYVSNQRYFFNKVRTAIFNGNINVAVKLFKENSEVLGNGFSQNIVFKLLQLNTAKIIEEKQKIIELIKAKKYSEVSELLTQKEKNTSFEKMIIFLLTKLDEIKNGVWEEKEEYKQTEKFDVAMYDENYELAYKLSKAYSQNKGFNNEDNVIAILLEEIVELIKKEKETRKELEKLTFVDIATSVIQDDFQTSIAKIKLYLEQIECLEYEFLVMSLYKIGLKENDLAFSKMILELSKLSDKDSYVFDFSKFVQKFYQCLANNDYLTAKIYLDILDRYSKEEKYIELVSGLKNILGASQRIVENNHRIDAFEQAIAERNIVTPKKDVSQQTEVVKKKSEVAEVSKTVVIKQENSPKDEQIDQEYQSDVDFITEKKEKLSIDNSIIILRPMDNIRRKRIHEITRKMDNVSSFSIGSEKNRRIVLKYSVKKPEDTDLSELLKEGNALYFNKQYAKSIVVLEEALSYVYNPKAFIFALLGIAYLKIKKKDKAVNYLIVATELSKIENDLRYDFTDLIDDLTSKPSNNPDDEKKPRFRMNVTEFKPEGLKKFQIKNLKDILTTILLDNEDIDLVFEIYELSEEQSNIVRLIIARYYYSIKSFETGDKIFKVVERTKNKSEVVKNLLNEIRLNRQFYQYRENPDPVALVLSRKLEQTENQ
ncbi:MAG: hypothetical protein IJN13_03890 [Bacilli bacterium]|nr:hypothetical protein [Bacilli bacterium]